jgi:hypothetical protein
MVKCNDIKMQKSTTSGAFDVLKRKRLRQEKLAEKLQRMKKSLEKKIKPQKLKSLQGKQAQKSKLANLIISIELRKKMDAVKQNIRKTD